MAKMKRVLWQRPIMFVVEVAWLTECFCAPNCLNLRVLRRSEGRGDGGGERQTLGARKGAACGLPRQIREKGLRRDDEAFFEQNKGLTIPS